MCPNGHDKDVVGRSGRGECRECISLQKQRAKQAGYKWTPHPDKIPHGTSSGYLNYKCRCAECREAHNSYIRARYALRREEIMAGLACVVCGVEDNLQMDHINPDEKSFSISTMLQMKSLPSIQAELEKCQPLCRTCHIKKASIWWYEGRSHIVKDVGVRSAPQQGLWLGWTILS